MTFASRRRTEVSALIGRQSSEEVVATRYLLVIAAMWVAIGLVVACLLRRRGHAFYPWFALGTTLGPSIECLAIERARFYGVAVHVGRRPGREA